ncbi:NAD+ synthase [Balneolaceae bacterium YR4-1]|uniref:Glutamine-dependent NAD(+) synthetase n=1 Tax=Halalkalibaculum roseum TaxID=2709311 RepID=A0A6M1SZ82_9BACT|nr:NAD+ synthase [Halalkalibaculum roseum]NGP77226.1 NAD+ synthase [Halalkalibaculum roseum]
MKVRTQQLNPTIGDLKTNVEAILKALEEAENDGIDLLILPELTVCGYPPMDLLERESFRQSIYRMNERITSATVGTTIIFGSVTDNPSPYGRKCFNSALVAENGELIGEVHKTLLPTYDVFDDLRYFEENKEFRCIEIKGIKLGITICEDIWYNENDIQYHTYETNPACKLAELGAEAIINISASPFTKTKPDSRRRMLQNHVGQLGLPIFYANQIGANTEIIFDGDSMVIDKNEKVIARARLFEEDFIDVFWKAESNKVEAVQTYEANKVSNVENMFKALVLGLKDYMAKTGVADKVILGLSGGIDSSLVACIAASALGPEKVTGVTMPSEFSSKGSIDHSRVLAKNLGITFKQISIKELYDGFLENLEPFFKGTSFGIAEENLQSRIRGDLLMAISNKFGHMLLNSGNKSELATGYCTLYGDMAGGLGIIADLYKTEVYEMASWLNSDFYEEEIIPREIIDKAPSAELKPNQQDSDTLPDYSILDSILELYIEKQLSAEDIINNGFDEDTVKKVIKLVDYTEYKRYQSVPTLKVSTKAFGTGRRWPIVQKWTENQI